MHVRSLVAVGMLTSSALAAQSRSGQAPVSTYAPWTVQRDRAEASSILTIATKAVADVTVGSTVARPAISIRCESHHTTVTFLAGIPTQPANGPSRTIRYHVDGGGAIAERWSSSPTGDTLEAPHAEQLVGAVLFAKKLFIDFTPVGSNGVVTAEFVVDGLRSLLPEIAQNCSRPGSFSLHELPPNDHARGVIGTTPQAPVNDDQTYFEFQVSRPATLAPGNDPPPYPELLRKAKVEGQVLAQFVVDTAGRVDMHTFRVLRESHPLFTEALRSVLPGYKFEPAEISRHKVRQLVQMPFAFALSK